MKELETEIHKLFFGTTQNYCNEVEFNMAATRVGHMALAKIYLPHSGKRIFRLLLVRTVTGVRMLGQIVFLTHILYLVVDSFGTDDRKAGKMLFQTVMNLTGGKVGASSELIISEIFITIKFMTISTMVTIATEVLVLAHW